MRAWLMEYLGLELREAVAWSLAGLFLGLLGWRERTGAWAAARYRADLKAASTVRFDVSGVRYFEHREARELLLIGMGQPYAGRLSYQDSDGRWSLLRKATPEDLERIDSLETVGEARVLGLSEVQSAEGHDLRRITTFLESASKVVAHPGEADLVRDCLDHLGRRDLEVFEDEIVTRGQIFVVDAGEFHVAGATKKEKP